MYKVTIVGSSFAALTAVRALRSSGVEVEIDLISPEPQFVYLPSVIWLPSGIRKSQDITIPLEPFFERMNVNYIAAHATGLRDNGRTLVTNVGALNNDALIIASGCSYIKALPGIEHAIIPCSGVAAGEQIRDKLKTLTAGTIAFGFSGNPKEPGAVRGGPMFELLFGIDRQLRKEGRRDQFNLTFFTPAAEPGNRLGPKAVQGLQQIMLKRNIGTHLGHKIKKFTPDRVITAGGEIPADMILFIPGMTGSPWFDATDLPRSPGGMIQADAHCKVTGYDKVYVAGDAGSFPGPDWMPKQAHMADLQAKAAVKNLLAEFKGQPPRAIPKSELICLIDSFNSGMLVARTEKYNIMLPDISLLHWAKRGFEQWYIRQYLK